ncbi:hypothetical protein LWI28_027728 [Acer negundo]|uniref:Uncharacterized protein n=1 Tax=Acer negundo TaxID=4023 RepID=A0AAD5JHZ7_ACENE|nr:hypothetical protein LWI28_027728 [Acer negundo]
MGLPNQANPKGKGKMNDGPNKSNKGGVPSVGSQNPVDVSKQPKSKGKRKLVIRPAKPKINSGQLLQSAWMIWGFGVLSDQKWSSTLETFSEEWQQEGVASGPNYVLWKREGDGNDEGRHRSDCGEFGGEEEKKRKVSIEGVESHTRLSTTKSLPID